MGKVLKQKNIEKTLLQESESFACFILYTYSKYSRRGIYNQREKYNQWPFRGLFSYVKIFFSIFFFLHLKLRTICYKKQEKKVRKHFVLEVKN